MFRSIGVAFVMALALRQVTSNVDVSKHKNVLLELTNADIVPKHGLTDVQGFEGETREKQAGFVGDLTIGQRYADETVFRRVVEFNNPMNYVQSFTLKLAVENGIIHYISAKNNRGSYAVVCEDPNSLNTSRGSINLRMPPNSASSLVLVIATHSPSQLINFRTY